MIEPLLNVTDCASLLSCSKATCLRHIASGRLQAVNLGLGTRAEYRVTQRALEAFLNASKSQPQPKYSAMKPVQTSDIPDYFDPKSQW